MRYVTARIEQNNRDEAYRIYVCKSLQLIPQNKCLTKDLKDFYNPKEEDMRTADEIADSVMQKAGLKFG